MLIVPWPPLWTAQSQGHILPASLFRLSLSFLSFKTCHSFVSLVHAGGQPSPHGVFFAGWYVNGRPRFRGFPTLHALSGSIDCFCNSGTVEGSIPVVLRFALLACGHQRARSGPGLRRAQREAPQALSRCCCGQDGPFRASCAGFCHSELSPPVAPTVAASNHFGSVPLCAYSSSSAVLMRSKRSFRLTCSVRSIHCPAALILL